MRSFAPARRTPRQPALHLRQTPLGAKSAVTLSPLGQRERAYFLSAGDAVTRLKNS